MYKRQVNEKLKGIIKIIHTLKHLMLLIQLEGNYKFIVLLINTSNYKYLIVDAQILLQYT